MKYSILISILIKTGDLDFFFFFLQACVFSAGGKETFASRIQNLKSELKETANTELPFRSYTK